MQFNPRLSGILIFVLCYAFTSAQEVNLQKTEGFGSNPGNLEMFSYVPSQLAGENAPLVVVLHGCTQSAEEVALQTGWNKLADSLGFFVLYPQTGFSNNMTNCFNWFKEKDIASDEGECASIFQMLNHFQMEFSVDTSRIFITGLSAGGAMAVAMLARYPDLFSAGAIVAGGPYGAAWNIRSAKKAMRGKVIYTREEWANLVRLQNPDFNGIYPTISVFHGTNDKTVQPANAEYLIAQWTQLHGAKISPSLVNKCFEELPFVELKQYMNARDETIARWYVLQGMKHALSIATGDAIHQGGTTGKYTIDTGFHIPWQCAVDFGLTE